MHYSAGLRCLMCTGDFHGTALAVARGVGMIPPQGRVIIIQKEVETRPASARATTSFEAEDKILQSQQDLPVQHIAPTLSIGQGHSALKAASKVAQPAAYPARQGSHGVSLADGVEHPKVRSHHTVAFAEDVFGAAKQQQHHQQSPDDAVCASQNQPCSMSFSRSRYGVSSSEYGGLVFHVDNGCEAQDGALQALTAIAQVSMLCHVSHCKSHCKCNILHHPCPQCDACA